MALMTTQLDGGAKSSPSAPGACVNRGTTDAGNTANCNPVFHADKCTCRRRSTVPCGPPWSCSTARLVATPSNMCNMFTALNLTNNPGSTSTSAAATPPAHLVGDGDPNADAVDDDGDSTLPAGVASVPPSTTSAAPHVACKCLAKLRANAAVRSRRLSSRSGASLLRERRPPPRNTPGDTRDGGLTPLRCCCWWLGVAALAPCNGDVVCAGCAAPASSVDGRRLPPMTTPPPRMRGGEPPDSPTVQGVLLSLPLWALDPDLSGLLVRRGTRVDRRPLLRRRLSESPESRRGCNVPRRSLGAPALLVAGLPPTVRRRDPEPLRFTSADFAPGRWARGDRARDDDVDRMYPATSSWPALASGSASKSGSASASASRSASTPSAWVEVAPAPAPLRCRRCDDSRRLARKSAALLGSDEGALPRRSFDNAADPALALCGFRRKAGDRDRRRARGDRDDRGDRDGDGARLDDDDDDDDGDDATDASADTDTGSGSAPASNTDMNDDAVRGRAPSARPAPAPMPAPERTSTRSDASDSEPSSSSTDSKSKSAASPGLDNPRRCDEPWPRSDNSGGVVVYRDDPDVAVVPVAPDASRGRIPLVAGTGGMSTSSRPRLRTVNSDPDDSGLRSALSRNPRFGVVGGCVQGTGWATSKETEHCKGERTQSTGLTHPKRILLRPAGLADVHRHCG